MTFNEFKNTPETRDYLEAVKGIMHRLLMLYMIQIKNGFQYKPNHIIFESRVVIKIKLKWIVFSKENLTACLKEVLSQQGYEVSIEAYDTDRPWVWEGKIEMKKKEVSENG